jgi:hypothetical protein
MPSPSQKTRKIGQFIFIFPLEKHFPGPDQAFDGWRWAARLADFGITPYPDFTCASCLRADAFNPTPLPEMTPFSPNRKWSTTDIVDCTCIGLVALAALIIFAIGIADGNADHEAAYRHGERHLQARLIQDGKVEIIGKDYSEDFDRGYLLSDKTTVHQEDFAPGEEKYVQVGDTVEADESGKLHLTGKLRIVDPK